MRRGIVVLAGTFFLGIFWGILAKASMHSVLAQGYPLPNEITVTMYELDNVVRRTNALCQMGSLVYGCTVPAEDANFPYPYQTNPVTVSMEEDYLLDVVPQETSPVTFPDAALRAQAIAARTYAYWHIHNDHTINNSTDYQAFIPRRFDQFSTANQTRIRNAVQPRYYLTVPASELSIFAQFSTDAYLYTVSGDTNESHLRSVPDPISYDPAIPDIIQQTGAHQRGMSQNGAGRWAWGNSSRAGTGTAWGFNWTDYRQILVHYYTGIHLRDANGIVLTPNHRWNLLQYEPTAPVMPAQMNPVNIVLQNTGTLAIEGGQFGLFGVWCRMDDPGCPTREQLRVETIPNQLSRIESGDAITLTELYGPPDSSQYRLVFDICTFQGPQIAAKIQQQEEWCFSYPPAGQVAWVRQEVGIFGSGPNPTRTPTPPSATATPTVTAEASPTPTAVVDGTPIVTPTANPWSPVENAILQGEKLSRVKQYSEMLSALRDRRMMEDVRGKPYVDLVYRHAPEIMTIMQAHPELRQRARRLGLQVESALQEWLADGERADWSLSPRLRRQWARLLRDVESAASPELVTEMQWWRARMKRWDNQTLPVIWQSLLKEDR